MHHDQMINANITLDYAPLNGVGKETPRYSYSQMGKLNEGSRRSPQGFSKAGNMKHLT